MNKEKVEMIREILGGGSDWTIGKHYPLSPQTLYNWKNGRISGAASALLDIIELQHDLLDDEQKKKVRDLIFVKSWSEND